jgi:hypothetical protein
MPDSAATMSLGMAAQFWRIAVLTNPGFGPAMSNEVDKSDAKVNMRAIQLAQIGIGNPEPGFAHLSDSRLFCCACYVKDSLTSRASTPRKAVSDRQGNRLLPFDQRGDRSPVGAGWNPSCPANRKEVHAIQPS